MMPTTGLSEQAHPDIVTTNWETVIDITTTKLREAIDVVFFAQDPQANEMERLRKYREFKLNKFGIVQFSDDVTRETKDSRDIVSRVQEKYDELISLI